ncbi:hypothetical protein E4U54_001562, partial [Claviceps lovelessii]
VPGTETATAPSKTPAPVVRPPTSTPQRPPPAAPPAPPSTHSTHSTPQQPPRCADVPDKRPRIN